MGTDTSVLEVPFVHAGIVRVLNGREARELLGTTPHAQGAVDRVGPPSLLLGIAGATVIPFLLGARLPELFGALTQLLVIHLIDLEELRLALHGQRDGKPNVIHAFARVGRGA